MIKHPPAISKHLGSCPQVCLLIWMCVCLIERGSDWACIYFALKWPSLFKKGRTTCNVNYEFT